MKKFIFILGGIKSGKSSYAVKLAKVLRKKTAFIATCTALDEETKKRIRLHKLSRPRSWKTIEAGCDAARAITCLKNKYEVVIIDCLGLFISNLLAQRLTDEQIIKELRRFAEIIKSRKHTVILVSNEVGQTLVPVNLLARRFSDLLGFSNQIMAKNADDIFSMQAGIAIRIKGGDDAKIKCGIRKN